MEIDYKNMLKILVVADAKAHRGRMTSGIERINPFAMIHQATGLDHAIIKLSNATYDVVVSDWNMAGGGGDQLAQWMRARESFKHIPFVMISSDADHEAIAGALMELEVDACVAKPLTPQDLYRNIIVACDKRNKSISGSAGARAK